MSVRAAVAVAAALLALAASHAAPAKGPHATVANGEVDYHLVPMGAETTLSERAAASGRLLRHESVPGVWAFAVANGRARGLSRDGAVLVLVQFPFPALAQRTESRFAVIDTRRLRLVRVLRVPGRLAFGGLSADGRRLTLIERGRSGTHNRVHVLGFAR